MKHLSPGPMSVESPACGHLWIRAPDIVVIKQPKKVREETTDSVCRAILEWSPLQSEEPNNEQ